MTLARLEATDAASALLFTLEAEHGAVCFVCVGGARGAMNGPLCLPVGEFRLGDGDVYVGSVHGAPLYLGAGQYAKWHDLHITVDAVRGRSDGFSIETPHGWRFVLRTRPFLPDERQLLHAMGPPLRGEMHG